MEKKPNQQTVNGLPSEQYRYVRKLLRDSDGAALVEFALALPILVLMLSGVLTYSLWFLAANSLQQVANDASRSVLGTLNSAERQARVDASVANSLVDSGVVQKKLVKVSSDLDGRFYTVTLSYDISKNPVFERSLVPLPGTTISRSATVELSTL